MTPAQIAAFIVHGPDCTSPEFQTYMTRHAPRGVRTRCRTCGRGVAHDDPRLHLDPEPPPKRAPVTNYRCRVHTDQPTTWRGTGCTRCAAEKSKRTTRRQRRAARLARRASREAEDYTTPTTEGEHA